MYMHFHPHTHALSPLVLTKSPSSHSHTFHPHTHAHSTLGLTLSPIAFLHTHAPLALQTLSIPFSHFHSSPPSHSQSHLQLFYSFLRKLYNHESHSMFQYLSALETNVITKKPAIWNVTLNWLRFSEFTWHKSKQIFSRVAPSYRESIQH